MPIGDRFGTCRSEQPRCQHVLSRASSGGAQPFEERTFAEDVKIGGVWVIFAQIGKAFGTSAGPPAFKPRQPVRIERDGAPRSVARSPDRLVSEDQTHKQHTRHGQPPRRDSHPAIDQKAQDHDGHEKDEAQVGDSTVPAGRALKGLVARAQSLTINVRDFFRMLRAHLIW